MAGAKKRKSRLRMGNESRALKISVTKLRAGARHSKGKGDSERIHSSEQRHQRKMGPRLMIRTDTVKIDRGRGEQSPLRTNEGKKKGRYVTRNFSKGRVPSVGRTRSREILEKKSSPRTAGQSLLSK